MKRPAAARIALIGPVSPFRGGIAQYTSELYQSLHAKTSVELVSFARLYPKFLYPGDSETLPDAPTVPEAQYLLNIYNPFTWRKTTDTIVASGCEAAILTWWTLIWQPGFAYIARRLRKKGVRTLYVCHNVLDHQSKGVMGTITSVVAPLSRYWLKQADYYLVQSTAEAKKLRDIYPTAKFIRRPHPVYDRFPAPTQQLPARGKLDLLFFGLIRPYKGLDILLEALRQIDSADIHLTIAGEVWGDDTELLAQIKQLKHVHVEPVLRYVSDEEASNLVSRADAVVVPYRAATGSGVAALSYYFGKPLIGTDVAGLQDVVEHGKTGYLVAPESPQELAAIIQKTSRKQLAAMRPNIEKYCENNSWDAMTSAIISFVKS